MIYTIFHLMYDYLIKGGILNVQNGGKTKNWNLSR